MTHIRRLVVPLSLLLAIIAVAEASTSKVVCVLSGSMGECALDVGEVNKGDIIRPWARIKNLGDKEVHVTQPPGPAAAVSGLPPRLATYLKPGQVVVFELPPLSTVNFEGPVQKVYSFQCEPPSTIEVALYRTHQDVERDN